MVTPQTVRRVILTGSVAVITIMGTVYGAQLREDQQRVQQRKRAQANPAEAIAQLEGAREDMVRRKKELERKIESVREKRMGVDPQEQGQGRGRGR